MMLLPRFLRLSRCPAALCLALVFAGCVQPPPKPKLPEEPSLGKRPGVPEFMKGTLYELTNLENDEPFLVSAWGLVVNLDGTGGSEQIPNVVKAYMAKEMEKNGFGSKLSPAFQNLPPEAVLHDKNAAVVGVYAFIPPGARKGQWFDVAVSALGDEVTSLARGQLYHTELKIDGADKSDPTKGVNVFATAGGPVFVNPAFALRYTQNPDATTKRSLRTGIIMDGAQVVADRPLFLRIREPEGRLARAIESRVNEYYHQDRVCTAYTGARCQLWVPPSYHGDWEHFSKLVMHLFMNGGSEAFARAKARALIAEARKPGAPLQDISYCWEGLGSYALAELAPLLADSSAPADVRFAAARAAAYIGDPSGAAERALFAVAQTDGSEFQLPAVEVLGRVENSPAVNRLLRELLDSDKTTVRIEAYNVLAQARDAAIDSRVIASARDSSDQKFFLDLVHCQGAPLVYATRSGIPRIAIFGDVPQLKLPVTFAAMDDHLTISSAAVGRDVTIFYRDVQLPAPVQISSPPDIANILVRLAGQMDDGIGQLNFTYAEVLAILQGLNDQQKLRVLQPTGEEVAASFLMQAPPSVHDAIDSAPALDRGRPQGDNNAPTLDRPAPGAAPKQVGAAIGDDALGKQ